MKNEANREYKLNLDLEDEVSEPSMYQVSIQNDDYTPMEFVVSVLEQFFFMNRLKATSVMMEAHVSGKSICGVFSKDLAEAKVAQIVEHAQKYEHPLICCMEGK